MAFKNTIASYGSISKLFHWIMSFLIFAMIIVGFIMDDLPEHMQSTIYLVHKSLGLVLLTLVILRILWTLNNPKPLLPPRTRPWEIMIERLVHLLLYVFMLAMPLSGWIMSSAAGYHPNFFGLITLPMPGIPISESLSAVAHDVHTISSWALITVVVLHMLAALKHHFIHKDNILKRMMPNS